MKSLNQLEGPMRQQKILENMSLIHYAMRQLEARFPIGMSQEDALQYGCIGLIEAIDHYQEERGRFSTFAYIRIRGAIMDGIFQYQWMSRNQIRDAQKWRKARERLEMERGALVTQEEVADYLHVKPKKGEIWQRLANVSILYSDAVPLSEEFVFHEAASDDCSDIVENTEEQEALRSAIHTLNQMEQTLIEEYYFQCKSLKEIAKENGISHNWACALHRRSLIKLRKQMIS